MSVVVLSRVVVFRSLSLDVIATWVHHLGGLG
jgi:hypothetical protein